MAPLKASGFALLIGVCFWAGLAALSFLGPALAILPSLPLEITLGLGLVILPGAAFTGAVAGAARTLRFWKILGAAFLAYIACAIAAAAFMILGDPSPYPPDNAMWRKLAGSFALGLTGALLFALPVSPFFALAVFLLERKTRPPTSPPS